VISEHTCRIIRRMVNSLDEFQVGRLSFQALFHTLEGSLLAVEDRLSDNFYNEWDKYWITFEIGLADNAINPDFYKDEILGMRDLLLSIGPMFNEESWE
jgi:hypothetical protein